MEINKIKQETLNHFMESIACEEHAIAKLIEAESKKLKKVASMHNPCYGLKANESAICLLHNLTLLENVLKEELKLVKQYMDEIE